MMSISVVICSYSNERLHMVERAVKSVEMQTLQPQEIIVVVDHNEELFKTLSNAYPDHQVIVNTGSRGLSGARNSGVEASYGDIIAFLDDDASAFETWLEHLVFPFEDPHVVATGGLIRPDFEAGAPKWMPEEFLWTVGCSYKGLPESETAIRNPIGASMAYRRDALTKSGLFDEKIGRIGSSPLGCEETELAIRSTKLFSGAKIVYVPSSVVMHTVTSERGQAGYFLKRCYMEGISKALVASRVGKAKALESERTYATVTLPKGFYSYIVSGFKGNRFDFSKAAFILGGLMATAAGYLKEKLVKSVRI